MITNIDQAGIDFTGYWECEGDPMNPKWLSAYEDSGGVWTIGIGTTIYPNGNKVKRGDIITAQERDQYFIHDTKDKVAKVNNLTRDDINQHQFNAIADFVYNIGTTAFQKSTFLKVVNHNPEDPTIVNRFCDWRFDNGQFVKGLLRRRMSLAFLYFTGKKKADWINYKEFSQKTIDEVLHAINSTA